MLELSGYSRLGTNIKQIDFSFAYEFADRTVSAIRQPEVFGLSPNILPDFFGFKSDQFFTQIEKPHKYTLLHEFIYSLNFSSIEWLISRIDSEEANEAYGYIVKSAGIEAPEWLNAGPPWPNKHNFEELVEKAARITTDAAFHLLYADRTFLFDFNMAVAPYIKILSGSDHHCIKLKGGVKRAMFPKWVINAVHHRDRGRCQLCGKDLSNIYTPVRAGSQHIDHMVPLNSFGTNDPTNLQLACSNCNTSKQDKLLARKHLSYTYW